MTNQPKYHIGLVIYPGMTQLDITAPHQVFSFIPEAQVHMLWKNLERHFCGEETAKRIQLVLEYNPAPPFDAGCPENAGEILVEQVKQFSKPLSEELWLR
ncbi:MAG: hypothetical protein WBF90_30365 [Rivularia sp. (in: cyanobacteria)]